MWFGVKQAVACAFPVGFFLLLGLSRVVTVPGLARYDLVLAGAVLLQLVLVGIGFETWRDVRVALRFHVLGLALELFKTAPAIGSWSYPEPALTKLATVPLYSGFLYAAVASYVIAAWRLLRLRFTRYPSRPMALAVAAAIYVNFFTHHWLPDLRGVLMGLTLVVFGRTRVHFTPRATERWMPLPLAFVLIGFFVWVAENVSTFLGAWAYPDQLLTWQAVHLGKLTSWSLLVIVTIVVVGEHMRARGALTSPLPRRVRGPGWAWLPAFLGGRRSG
ncbi:MAG: DUF817 domain-containing protein [Actinobacteria bacterium]|nr:DUF817 domain-containing protein [Actinomycetota bacterium]